MIKLFIKKFVRNYEQTHDTAVRKAYGTLGGVLGICCNMLLFIIKFLVGFAINSIAVVSDAFNNLSDTAASAVGLFGSRLSGKNADKEHPFGHGRAEYISSLIVAFFIILVGFELLRDSAGKIIHPEKILLSGKMLLILLLSIAVKLWMFSYNRYMGRLIDAPIMMAASKDSLSDVIATSAVIVSTILSHYTDLPVDGIVGIVVSALVMLTGYGVAKDTIGKLLGHSARKETIDEITRRVLEGENVLGMHGLMIHDYGPGHTVASVHAEVPDNLTLIEVHSVIDRIEHNIQKELGIDIVIHMDPVKYPKTPPNTDTDTFDNPSS